MKKISVLTFAAFFAFGAFAYADIDNIDIGGDIMMEYFFSDNIDLNTSKSAPDESDFLRMEAHLWFQADLDDNITARISLEVDREYSQTNIGHTNVAVKDDSGMGDLGVFLEEALIKVANIGGSGFSIAAGRQFLNYGDDPLSEDQFNTWWGPGFIIADSNSASTLRLSDLGSYEIDPFDSVVGSYQTETARVDLIYARDVEDFYTNRNGPGPGPNTNDDASMWALYGSYYGIEGHQLDLYFTWNREERNSVNGNLGFDGDKMIIGGRAAGDLTEAFAYKAEIAYQFEDSDTMNRADNDALAGQLGINYHPAVDYEPNVGLIYTYLAEDNNGIGFAAPYEGKTFGLITEGLVKFAMLNTGLGNDFTNMHVFNLNGGLLLNEDVAWTLDLYYLMMDDDDSKGDDTIGFEVDTQIDYRFNDNLTTFVGGGVFFPDDAAENAAGNNDDEALFFRAGVKVNF